MALMALARLSTWEHEFGLGELAEAFAKFIVDYKKITLKKVTHISMFNIASKRGISLGICQNKYLLMQLKRR